MRLVKMDVDEVVDGRVSQKQLNSLIRVAAGFLRWEVRNCPPPEPAIAALHRGQSAIPSCTGGNTFYAVLMSEPSSF